MVNIFIFIFPSITQQSKVFYIYAKDCFAVSLKVLPEPGNLTANHSSCLTQILRYKHRSVVDTAPLSESALACRSDSVAPAWTPPWHWLEIKNRGLWGKSCGRTRILFHVSFWQRTNVQFHSKWRNILLLGFKMGRSWSWHSGIYSSVSQLSHL